MLAPEALRPDRSTHRRPRQLPQARGRTTVGGAIGGELLRRHPCEGTSSMHGRGLQFTGFAGRSDLGAFSETKRGVSRLSMLDLAPNLNRMVCRPLHPLTSTCAYHGIAQPLLGCPCSLRCSPVLCPSLGSRCPFPSLRLSGTAPPPLFPQRLSRLLFMRVCVACSKAQVRRSRFEGTLGLAYSGQKDGCGGCAQLFQPGFRA